MADENNTKTIQDLEKEASYSNTEKTTPTSVKTASKLVEDEIHAMPKKFLPSAPSKKSSSGKGKLVGALVALVLFIVLLIGGSVYFVTQSNQANQQNQNTNTNVNTNTNTNSNQNQNQNTNTNTNSNQNTNVNTNTNTNSNQNQNQNTNTNTNSNQNTNVNINNNTNTNTNQNTGINSDSDGDLLSSIEESLYKTNTTRVDTDLDGFSDGGEVRNLYDPLVPNGLLIDSGLVVEYSSTSSGYALLHPETWVAEVAEGTSGQILILPDSESGEFFSITVLPASSGLTYQEWQNSISPGKQWENFLLAGTTGIRALDSTEAVLITDGQVYVFNYVIPEGNSRNYESTFIMMLNSFQFISAQ